MTIPAINATTEPHEAALEGAEGQMECAEVVDEMDLEEDAPTEEEPPGEEEVAAVLSEEEQRAVGEAVEGGVNYSQDQTMPNRVRIRADTTDTEFPETEGEGSLDPRTDLLQKDAFVLFRALCKLSTKQLPEGATAENFSLRSKVLSLELLNVLLKSSGPGFRTSEKFTYAIKHYLCKSLIENSVSSVAAIFRLTLEILATLMSRFKEALKSEIGVFFNSVFLGTLETQISSFAQKLLVLRLINTQAQDSQTIVDLFLNFDCDLECEDLYARLVNALSGAALGSNLNHKGLTPEQIAAQEGALHQLALEGAAGGSSPCCMQLQRWGALYVVHHQACLICLICSASPSMQGMCITWDLWYLYHTM